MNPLLDFSGLPRFDAVAPEHVAPAIRELIDGNRALIDRLVADPTLLQPQREANLLTRLEEYLPFGLEAALIYVT